MNAAEELLPRPRKDIRVSEHGAKPFLIDPANGIYRFSNGVCRRLDRDTTPWKVRKFEKGESPDDLSVYYQALSTDFGISVPKLSESASHTINYQDPVYIYVSISAAVDAGDENFFREILTNPSGWGKSASTEVPVSSSFQAYRSDSSRLILLNQALQTAVDCPFGVDPSDTREACKAYILLNKEEMAIFYITYAGFIKLEQVTISIRELATTLRANCPNK